MFLQELPSTKERLDKAGINAGANEVHLIEEPLAAAIGSGIEIADSTGNMIIDTVVEQQI